MEYDMIDNKVFILVICYIIFNHLRECEDLIFVGCNISFKRGGLKLLKSPTRQFERSGKGMHYMCLLIREHNIFSHSFFFSFATSCFWVYSPYHDLSIKDSRRAVVFWFWEQNVCCWIQYKISWSYIIYYAGLLHNLHNGMSSKWPQKKTCGDSKYY